MVGPPSGGADSDTTMLRGFLLFALLWAGGGTSGWAQEGLDLATAESLALANDPLLRRHQARAKALLEEARVAAALPDPRLQTGLANFPWAAPSLAREPMTQMVLGVRQAFPAPGVRRWRAERLRLLAKAEQAQAEARALEVLRALRQAWLELYYQVEAAALIEESEAVFDQWVRVTQYRYRAGRGTQHAVVRARLEQALLQDRREAVLQRRETVLAELNRWLGPLPDRPAPRLVLPELPEPPPRETLYEALERHPRLRAARLEALAARRAVGVAKAQRLPEWALTVRYGLRTAERADFLTATVDLSLPLFQARRQRPRIDAAGYRVNAAHDRHDEVRRRLRRELEATYARWERLDRRLQRYATHVLPQAARNSEATRRAYRSRVSDFDELVRARLAELEARLTDLRLRVDRAQSYYGLRYFMGEEAS